MDQIDYAMACAQFYWGPDGWTWERILPETMTNPTAETVRLMQEQSQRAGHNLIEVWRNAHWFVHVSRERAVLCNSALNVGDDSEFPEMIWLSMRRTDRWQKATDRDWREMQRVKNELVGQENEAVELYPAESRLQDEADQFHLWVFKDPSARFPFGYLKRRVSDKPVEGPGTQRPLDE